MRQFHPNPGTRQSPSGIGIDYSNPLARGLVAAFGYVGGRAMDIKRGVAASGNSGTPRGGAAGMSLAYNGSSQSTSYANTADYGLANGSGFTIVVFADVDVLSSYSQLVACQDSTTTSGFEFRLGSVATDSVLLLHRANSGGYYQHTAGAGNKISAGSKNNCIAVVADLGLTSVPTFYANGVAYTGSSLGGVGSGNLAASSHSLFVGTRESGTTWLTGSVNLALLYNRKLSAVEIERLRANRWQILKKRRQTWFAGTVGGAGVNLTVTDIAQAQALDAPTLSWDAALSPGDVAQAQAIDSPAVSTDTILVPAAVGQAQAVDSIALSVSGATDLSADDISQTQAIDAAVVSTVWGLSVADVTQPQALDNVTLTPGTSGVLTDSEKIDLILDILANRQTLDAATGIYTLYADDGATVLYTAAAWEDIAGTTPYRGRGLARLDAMQ